MDVSLFLPNVHLLICEPTIYVTNWSQSYEEDND